MESKKFLLDKW